jgi:ubiquinone/menaquinone biosynthesis C-methylase UbiE
MRLGEEAYYQCPETGSALKLEIGRQEQDEVVTGWLTSRTGRRHAINDGIPDLTFPPVLHATDEKSRNFYNQRAEIYDKYLHLTFETFWEDETVTRNKMVDTLELEPHHRVLEVSCGSGRDSALLAQRLDASGKLYLQDISLPMLEKCVERLHGVSVPVEYSVSNGSYLPFPDRYFDAVYHFGGLGEFGDIKRALKEFARVTKVGGRVVVGDESMPPWLRETRFAKVLTATNPQFNAPLPLQEMPVEARDVRLRWVIGGVFYLIDFVVGEGEPPANFNYEIPGPRGGTHLTRVDGQLEGVKLETKALALKAMEKSGKSMHAWLDEVVKAAARRELGE